MIFNSVISASETPPVIISFKTITENMYAYVIDINCTCVKAEGASYLITEPCTLSGVLRDTSSASEGFGVALLHLLAELPLPELPVS